MPYNDDSIIYKGTWSNAAPFKVSDSTSATLEVAFFGDEALLTMGTGPDHGIYDVYVGNILWRSFDGYAATEGERAINLQLASEGPHILKIRNRTAQHANSTGNRLRFKRLEATGQVYSYDLRTNAYQYDALARLREADIFAGINTTGTPTAAYAYDFDVAGNRTRKDNMNYVYDAANRLVQSQFSYSTVPDYYLAYDDAGRMTKIRKPIWETGGGSAGAGMYGGEWPPPVGHEPIGSSGPSLSGFEDQNFRWDRANRLRQTYNSSQIGDGVIELDPDSYNNYVYNGLGQRLRQYPGVSLGTQFTDYTFDVAGGMPMVVATTENGSTTRYVHGMAAQQTPTGTWQYQLRDALGSVRGVIDHTQTVQERRHYDPYGTVTDQAGTLTTEFGYTGEQTDAANTLVYLRARYYHPELGVFLSLDPFGGLPSLPMSMNGYSYVEGNPTNWTDPSGKFVPFVILAAMAGGALGGAIYGYGKQAKDKMDCGMNPWEALDPSHADWGQVGENALFGAGLGFAAGSAIATATAFGVPLSTSLMARMLGHGLLGAGVDAGLQLLTTGSVHDWDSVLQSALVGAFSGGFLGHWTNGLGLRGHAIEALAEFGLNTIFGMSFEQSLLDAGLSVGLGQLFDSLLTPSSRRAANRWFDDLSESGRRWADEVGESVARSWRKSGGLDPAYAIDGPSLHFRGNQPPLPGIDPNSYNVPRPRPTGDVTPLRPSEGQVGRYDDLANSNPKNIAAHHVPSDQYMRTHQPVSRASARNILGEDYVPYNRNSGAAFNMEHLPVNQGRHRRTLTWGNSTEHTNYLALTPREALAADIQNLRMIYAQDGLYDSYIRTQLLELIKINKETWLNPSNPQRGFFDK